MVTSSRCSAYGLRAVTYWSRLIGDSTAVAQDVRPGIAHHLLFFIGQGVGGLLIKETVSELSNCGLADENLTNPIIAFLFFVAPHRPLSRADGFATILARMKMGRQLEPSLVKSLRSRNRAISALSNDFDQVCKEYNVSNICFFDQRPTGDLLIVPRVAAILEDVPSKSYNIDTNHRDIVRLSKSVDNLTMMLDVMCRTVRNKLGLSQCRNLAFATPSISAVKTKASEDSRHRTTKKENVYARLKRYDTLFLVDDSGLMFSQRWKIASHILASIAAIAVEYDKDGVDIRFFNEDSEGLNLDSSAKVMEVFNTVKPEGPTLTAERLDEELCNYVREYETNRRKKGPNLIILTDGEPEEGQDVESVIVKYARKLQEIGAPLLHVGLQFVQIGQDEDVAKFLQMLDDDLKEKHKLDRDVSLPSICPTI